MDDNRAGVFLWSKSCVWRNFYAKEPEPPARQRIRKGYGISAFLGVTCFPNGSRCRKVDNCTPNIRPRRLGQPALD